MASPRREVSISHYCAEGQQGAAMCLVLNSGVEQMGNRMMMVVVVVAMMMMMMMMI